MNCLLRKALGNLPTYPIATKDHIGLAREAGKGSPYIHDAGIQLKILLPKKKG